MLGTLRWYVAANAANGNGSISGDATVTATFDMPASSTALLPTQTGRQPRYWYDPLSQMLTLKRVA